MKIQAEITIATSQYENIKPIIELDTDNLGEGLELLEKLWDTFHNSLEGRAIHKTSQEAVDLNFETSQDEN